MKKSLFLVFTMGVLYSSANSQAVQAGFGALKDSIANYNYSVRRDLFEELLKVDANGFSERQKDTVNTYSRAILSNDFTNSTLPDIRYFIAKHTNGQMIMSGLPDTPQIYKIHPDVVFTAGYGSYFAPEHRAVNFVGIGTNLLGGIAGSGFDFIGAEKISSYFTENFGVSISIPVHNEDRLTSDFSFGLGKFYVGSLSLYPVLSMEQTDSANARVSSGIREFYPDAENFSSPSLSVGIPLKMKKLQYPMILTLGIRFPFYYPGDAIEAFGAFFSNDRSKFKKSGDVNFIFGLSFPISKLPEKNGENKDKDNGGQ